MYIINFHHEHLNTGTASESVIFGPYNDKEAALAALRTLVELVNDPMFRVDRDDPTYAGFNYDELEAVDRDSDLASEIWAEALAVTTMSDWFGKDTVAKC